MTKEEFIKVTDILGQLFLKEKIAFTDEAAEVWYEALSDLDYRRVREGIVMYSQENQWSPSIAEIRKYANKIPKYTKEEIHQFIVEAEKKEREKLDSVRF